MFFYVINGLISLIQILYIYSNFYIIFIIYFVFTLVIFIKYFHDNYIFLTLIYFIFMYVIQFLIMLFFNGFKFFNGIFYIERSSDIFLLLIYPLILLIIYLVTLFIDKCYRLVSFKDKIFLIIDKKKFITDGYIDTGNTLLYNNSPVIFLCKSQSSKIKFNEKINVSTINGNKDYMGAKALVSIGNNKDFHFVYICLSDEKTFNGCEVLLNAYLL